MVSSLAADARIAESVGGAGESEVPWEVMLAEQREMSAVLIADVHDRFLDAPKKYRDKSENLVPSREYYFQDFRLHRPPGK